MRWMICWNEEGGWGTYHYQTADAVGRTIIKRISTARDEEQYKLWTWLADAKVGDMLEFPLGIVVRTSEHATEIGYDREETGS